MDMGGMNSSLHKHIFSSFAGLSSLKPQSVLDVELVICVAYAELHENEEEGEE